MNSIKSQMKYISQILILIWILNIASLSLRKNKQIKFKENWSVN